MREAKIRRDWVAGELAALRVPNVRLLSEPRKALRLAEAAERWRESRADVAENTRIQHRTATALATGELGDRRIDELTPADVARLVAALVAKGRKRETIRKAVSALAQVFEFAGIAPNPPAIACRFDCRAVMPRSRSRRPASTSRPSAGCSRAATGFRCSCSM
jgi:Phage integrase, N-terminal SAM-like domain